jgi:hypothetical protein
MLSQSLARWGSSRYIGAVHRHAAKAISVRYLNVHEYISMELMASHGIQTPECHVAETPQEVDHIFNSSFHRSGGTSRTLFLSY